MSALGKSIRWVLVPISAVLVVAICIAAARGAVLLADRSCAPDSLVGGACVEPWHTTVVEVSIYGALVAAVLGLVILPSRIAPQLKRTVAVVLLLVGLALVGSGYFLTGWKELIPPLAVTVLTGGLALGWVWSRRRADASL